MKIFSFFSGSGFLDLGFETNGFEIVFVNEIDPEFMRAYQYSRQQIGMNPPVYGYDNGDINAFLNEETKRNELINNINAVKDSGELVGFIGGPPCPDFSVGGKNRGREGENGKLSLSYINLIIQRQPDFFLFENVKGLWKTKRHRQFYDELKIMLHNAGYKTTEKLVNALEFGVPQDRERILLFGVKSELLDNSRRGGTLVDFPWQSRQIYTMEDINRYDWPEPQDFLEGGERPMPSGIPRELTVQHWFETNHVNTHPNAKHYFTPRAGLPKMQRYQEGDSSKKSYKRLHRWRYSPTAAYGNNEVHLHPYYARRLSVAEVLAIQSLPENFVLPPDMSLTSMFKTIGNGVPYILSSGIARTINDYLLELNVRN
ncbi:DNA cytosine methyltransferase [Proteinivorax tanatarense]|uniref:DNA (cytosine-5-)-methyltransferase n=1 Tax=Proteinivorax tanatarense TaxID=1260629 RepID=A0AAU7VK84_9FIRM